MTSNISLMMHERRGPHRAKRGKVVLSVEKINGEKKCTIRIKFSG